MQACDEEKLLGHLGVVLYEYLGEEYPEVLGSILGALKAIVNVIGMTKMTPPIKDLLPRLTPLLKNRHEKVRLLLYFRLLCFHWSHPHTHKCTDAVIARSIHVRLGISTEQPCVECPATLLLKWSVPLVADMLTSALHGLCV